ncbi:hypothetical protein SLE2022_300800 [Rubroshorea leprosula]
MRPSWGKLGVVDTIYEEEDYDRRSSSSSSPSLSRSLSSPPSPLHCRIEAWSLTTGRKTDVLIHVQGTSFRLHKDPLSSRSIYLRRKLTDQSEITLSPPLNITAETFSLVADFCYGTGLALTPFNVAALRLAAELLQMTETAGEGDENLKQITESYFRRILAVNGEYASIVFKSCLALLPEAETTGFLISRCVEALCLTEDGDGVECCLDDVLSLHAEDFKIVAESMNQRFARHDVLYRIVDFYLEEHNAKITEAQKTQICNSIDCNKLSPQILLHVVQNPRMPLRFIVRAMLVEQLNTRRSIFSAANHKSRSHGRQPSREIITLGAILQRDAAMREAAQLKEAMTATSSRLEDLEKQVQGMKILLQDTEQERERPVDPSRNFLDSQRSISFHYGSENKIEIEHHRAAGSASFRLPGRAAAGSSLENSCDDMSTPRTKKNIAQRLIKGLRSALWKSNSGTKQEPAKAKISSKEDAGRVRVGENGSFHRNQRCFTLAKEGASPPSIWDFD